MPLLATRKRALNTLSPAGLKKRKVASKASSHQVLEAPCSEDIEDTASFTMMESKQVMPFLQPAASWLCIHTWLLLRLLTVLLPSTNG